MAQVVEGDLGEFPGSWLWRGLALAVVDIWGVYQGPSLSLSFN